MKFPFEATAAELEDDLDAYVDAVFASLQSGFMIMPRGAGFVDYPIFERGYESLKRASAGFRRMEPGEVLEAIVACPIAFIVVRAILGFTPPEWAYVASQDSGLRITQGHVRTLDREIRLSPLKPLILTSAKSQWVEALVKTACRLLKGGAAKVDQTSIHRLDKADTRDGLHGVEAMSSLGVPYAMLLYERFLGRPFAGHRDSVSELVGDALETAIEGMLTKFGIQFRKTRRAEKVSGFDQAPDFIIPDEFSPQIVIEAKLTEDDGTARDKVTRVQHLRELSTAGTNKPRFQVVACIGGRGFGVRREDMKKLLRSTEGKVFTLKTLELLVKHTRLQGFATK